MTTNNTPFTVGQELVVVRPDYLNSSSLAAPYDIPYGTVATVTEVSSSGPWVDVTLEPNASGETTWEGVHVDWFNARYDVEEEAPEVPARPLIDFSGSSRATAREYATAVNSRVLKPRSQTDLLAAANGRQVDAYDLNAALTDAMSSCATRAGQSMARRELTKKVRYLAHITQAVLENHADGLPSYESGERSRKIETLEGEVAALRTAGAEALAELERGTEALTDEVRAHAEYREQADAEVTRLLEIASVRDNLLAETVEVNDALTVSLEYALGLLATVDQGAAFQVLGFMDAHGVEIVLD